MREEGNIRQVDALGIDLMGFIFYDRSPRHVATMPGHMPQNSALTGVFVDAPESFILEKVGRYGLKFIQLHGGEPPELCASLQAKGLTVIKAFSIRQEEDLERTKAYAGCCGFFLFDTPGPARGGNGHKFDWTLLDGYTGSTPFLLSGGIGPDDIERLRAFTHPALIGYDLNSRFESSPGVKSVETLRIFLETLRSDSK